MTREDARNCALSFCAYTVREKENTNPTMTQEQTRQARGQAEDKRTSKEGRKRDKSRSKEDKKKGKHATSHITA